MEFTRSNRPLTYLFFSSSFICSARSKPVPFPACGSSGVVPFEACAAESFDLVVAVLRSADPGGTTSGETAMATRTEDQSNGYVL